ncbi:MAG TPA: hypothetical protein VHL58_03120 [Thermoanaerobaculia bacterium]|nr:hypothetical protein [Thermoanaerobaculia bacterium]
MKIDMSPEAIERRLRLASELRRLCIHLGKGKEIYEKRDPDRDDVRDSPSAEPPLKND